MFTAFVAPVASWRGGNCSP